MLSKNLTLASTVSRPQEIIFEKVGHEVVMLNLKKGLYFALDEIACEIWDLIAKPICVADLCSALLTEFDVTPEECQRDVFDFLEQLQEHDMLDVQKASKYVDGE